MSALSIIASSREKRLEVTEMLEGLERPADARRADLAHLDATIGLFDPDEIGVAVQPVRLKRRGGCDKMQDKSVAAIRIDRLRPSGSATTTKASPRPDRAG